MDTDISLHLYYALLFVIIVEITFSLRLYSGIFIILERNLTEMKIENRNNSDESCKMIFVCEKSTLEGDLPFNSPEQYAYYKRTYYFFCCHYWIILLSN